MQKMRNCHSWPATGPLPTNIVVADMTGSKCNAVEFPCSTPIHEPWNGLEHAGCAGAC